MNIKLILLSLVYCIINPSNINNDNAFKSKFLKNKSNIEHNNKININNNNMNVYVLLAGNNSEMPGKLISSNELSIQNHQLHYQEKNSITSVILAAVKANNYNIYTYKHINNQINKYFYLGGSNFLGEFMKRILDESNQASKKHIFTTGGCHHTIPQEEINLYLSKSLININQNSPFYDLNCIKNTIDDLCSKSSSNELKSKIQNTPLNIGRIKDLVFKIQQMINYCNKKEIKECYLFCSKKHEDICNIILNIYKKHNCISGNAVYLDNTDDTLEYYQKTNR